jgi:hypothetical protein
LSGRLIFFSSELRLSKKAISGPTGAGPVGWKERSETHQQTQQTLTKSATYPHGIKVRLAGGVVGRVKGVVKTS